MSLNIHPKNTKIFIGHKNEREVFENAFFNNSLHHAWLLEGPAGIGKATFAYHVINYLLSKNEERKYSVKDFNISKNNLSYKK